MGLLDNRWEWGKTTASARNSQPWVSSGAITASTVIKAKSGILGGVLVTAADAGGDIDVIIWDSPDSTLTGDDVLARVTITDLIANTQASFAAPSQEGVEARNGLYAQVVAGDCRLEVYYK